MKSSTRTSQSPRPPRPPPSFSSLLRASTRPGSLRQTARRRRAAAGRSRPGRG